MLRAVALVPSPPLLVPELTGRGAGESVGVRTAALAAAASLGEVADRWLALGVGDHDDVLASTTRGTFAGFGVDVPVALSPGAAEAAPGLALPALIAGWLRGEVAPRAQVEVALVSGDTAATACADKGRALRVRMDEDPSPWGLLVVGDGASTLTAKAPGSFDPRAAGVQERIDDALASADLQALAAFDAELCAGVGVGGLAAWQTLVGVVENDRFATRTLYRGAPFGVGYFAGTWVVTDAEAGE